MKPQGTYSYSGTEMLNIAYQYLSNMLDTIGIKALYAFILTTFTSSFIGSLSLLELWFTLVGVDAILAIGLAIRDHKFSIKKLYHWVIKVIVYTLSIYTVSTLLVHLVDILSPIVPVVSVDYAKFIVNLCVYIVILAEVSSILHHATSWNLPIPDVVRDLIERLNSVVTKLFHKKLEELDSDKSKKR